MRGAGVVFLGFLLALCNVIKTGQLRITLTVPPSQKRCFAEVLSARSTHSIRYHMSKSKEHGKPLVVEDSSSAEDAGFEVYIKNGMNDSVMYSSSTVKNSTAIHHTGILTSYSFCCQSYSDDELKVKFEISTGLDINDFGALPLKETDDVLNQSIKIVENLASEMSSIEAYRAHELRLIDHSDRLFSKLLSYTGVAIGFFFVTGCAQTLFLNQKLLNKKLE